MSTLDYIMELDEKYYMNTFGKRTPVCFEYGKGIYLVDTEGREYIDFFSGIAVNALGHAHPSMVHALQDQAAKLLHTSNVYYIKNQAPLVEKIVQSSCADRVFICSTGAEANEGAYKLAKIYFYKKGEKNRYKIISLNGSFHGRTLANVAATGQPKYQKPYHPLTPGFMQVPINDMQALMQAADQDTAAIILEVIQGECGVHPAGQTYLEQVRQLCDEKGILLIIDEVQTGMGRTGKLFGYERFGIEPDIFTLAKALGGGIPIGAICAKEHVAMAFEPGDHGTTFGGNPLACRAALCVFDIFEKEGLVQNAYQMGEYLKEKLIQLQKVHEAIVDVRVFGLMAGVDFDFGKGALVQSAMLKNGYLTGCVAGTTLRILPPLIINSQDIDGFIATLDKVISQELCTPASI